MLHLYDKPIQQLCFMLQIQPSIDEAPGGRDLVLARRRRGLPLAKPPLSAIELLRLRADGTCAILHPLPRRIQSDLLLELWPIRDVSLSSALLPFRR